MEPSIQEIQTILNNYKAMFDLVKAGFYPANQAQNVAPTLQFFSNMILQIESQYSEELVKLQFSEQEVSDAE